MNKATVKKSYLYSLIYQLTTILVPIITTPYLTRVIGADGIGRISYIESIVSYFLLFAAFGISTFAQREISYHQNDKEKCTIIFWENVIRNIFTTSIVLVFYIPLIIFTKEKLYLIFVLTIINVVFDLTWFFQGLEEFKVVCIKSTIVKIFQTILIFVLITKPEDISLYVWLICGATILRSISLLPSLRNKLIKIKMSDLHPLNNFKTISLLFLPSIAVQLYTILDKTMIGVITNSDFQNGYYELAIRIVKLSTTIITIIGTVMSPRIASFVSEGKIDEAREYIYKSFRFVWMLGIPMCIGLFLVSKNFVGWYFGDGYDDVVILIRILSFLTIIIGCSNVIVVQFLIPIKKEKIFTIVAFSAAGINVCANSLLIYFFSAIGAAIATIIAESFITIVLFIYLRKYLKLTRVFLSCWKYLLSGIVMACVLIIEDMFFQSTIFNTCIIVFSGASVYLISLLLMKDSFLVENIKHILNGGCKK